jgi:NTP pyrophosphatase (non-canonical NTP hydrolase)
MRAEELQIILEKIRNLSIKEPKTIEQRMLKLAEESGELAKEILIERKASGSKHKEPGKDGILGESIDVMLVVFSIYFASGGTLEDLSSRLETKSSKWQKYQDANLKE